MNAVVNKTYGGPEVLQYTQVPVPTPKAKQVLVQVYSSSVNAADWHILRASPWPVRLAFGLFSPSVQVLGGAVAGVVHSVGKDITKFKVGDKVFGDTSPGFGAFAEYCICKETDIVIKPDNISMDEAAACGIAATTAYKGVYEVAQVKPGQEVLVVGASSGCGSFAIQMAKSIGAHVTGTTSLKKKSLLDQFGIPAITEDVTKQNKQYDVILDFAAFRSIKDYVSILKNPGIYCLGGGSDAQLMEIMMKGAWTGQKTQKFVNYLSDNHLPHLEAVRDQLSSGQLKPYICRTFSLQQVPEAIKFMESRESVGKIVIKVRD
ncbi:NADPH:quinone reductase [Gorgonomyces haynaldii]|nr:NADPH:quinone reductase [Gorgonomyces haynaldii]